MVSSYSSTVKQASQGEKANLTFERLQKEGLDSALYSVHNTNSTAIFDEHGILIRSYDDVIDDYKDEQARINANEFVFTTDRWRTAITALGKQKYTLNGVTHEKYGLNTQFVISGLMVAGDIYSANYSNLNNELKGTHINLETGGFEMADGKLIYDAKTQKLSLKNVELSINFNNEEKDITDIVGDTIVSQTMHYLVSDKSEGITIESQGWTTDIQYVSNEKRYLWIYITNTKSNGDTENTSPIIYGVYGKDGEKGEQGIQGDTGSSYFTWIMYADDTNGTNISDTPLSSTQYIGIATNKESENKSNNPKDYTWSKYIGNDGVSVTTVVPIYFSSNSKDTAPIAPVNVIENNDTGYGHWTLGTPLYNELYPYYYTCNQILYSNNVYQWSIVVRDGAIENIAKTAYDAKKDTETISVSISQFDKDISSLNTFRESSDEKINDLYEKYNDEIGVINQHFDFTKDGIFISATADSDVKLWLRNNQIVFVDKYNNKLAYFTDQMLNVNKVNTSDWSQIGNFKWIPSASGGLRLVKVS